MPIKQIKSYSIDCTGDACQGDEILFTETVWGGPRRAPVSLGERRIAALIVKDSYGAAKQQHTFSLLVIGSDGYHALRKGTKIRRMGRNVYRNGTMRRPRNEAERNIALDEKHQRGDSARAARENRKATQ